MTDFPRESDSLVVGALNPEEYVIWTGHCLSRRGKQEKAGRGPEGSVGSCLFLLIAEFVIFVAVLGLTGSGVGLLAIFPLAIVTSWAQRTVLHSPDDAMYCRKQTVYVLTNQRVFILRNCQTAHPVQSLPLRFVDNARVERRQADGRGTVQFLRWDAGAHRWTYPMRFAMVQHSGAVVNLARAAIEKAKAGDAF
jgi:hypothetical protein